MLSHWDPCCKVAANAEILVFIGKQQLVDKSYQLISHISEQLHVLATSTKQMCC